MADSPGGLSIPEHAHQVEHVVDIVPVEDAAVDDGPATFVVAADDFCQVAVETDP